MSKHHTPDPRERDTLSWLAQLVAFAVTAFGEYQLGVAVGFGQYIAAGVPAALDIYVLRALRAGRDVGMAVVAMIITNALSHLVSARLLPVSVPLVVAVSAIAPLVLWRVHALHRAPAPALPVERPDETVQVSDWDTPGYAVSQGVPDAGYTEPAEQPLELRAFPMPDLRQLSQHAGVSAAEGLRIRTGVRAEYVPDGVPADVPAEDGEDDLAARVRVDFAEQLAGGTLPSIRVLRAEYGIGQPRATQLQQQLRQLVGAGASA